MAEMINRENVLMQLDRLVNNQVDIKIAKGITAAIHVIEKAPIEVEARPHGEWINTRPPEMSDNIVCSICGFDSIASYNFCPDCGALMQKEGDINK